MANYKLPCLLHQLYQLLVLGLLRPTCNENEAAPSFYVCYCARVKLGFVACLNQDRFDDRGVAAISVIYSGTRTSVNVKARRSGAQDRIRLPCTLRLLPQLRALRLLSLPCMLRVLYCWHVVGRRRVRGRTLLGLPRFQGPNSVIGKVACYGTFTRLIFMKTTKNDADCTSQHTGYSRLSPD